MRKVFNSIACASLPSRKTKEVDAEKTVAGETPSNDPKIQPPGPKALFIAVLFEVLPHGFPITDLI